MGEAHRVEVCVDSLESALAAQDGGADRIELCGTLSDGGITPSHGLLNLVCRRLSSCKVYVLVRPRGGDFLYTDEELEVMRHDVVHAAACGAHGVSLGMVTTRGGVATDQLRPFVELCAALGLDLTFHRAFDVVRDQGLALDDLIACGVKRVLTSGGRNSVLEGLDQIQALVQQGGDRISIMPGGGVTEETVDTIVSVTGVQEVHGTFKRRMPSAMQFTSTRISFKASDSAANLAGGGGGSGGKADGSDEWSRLVTDAEAVRRVRQKLAALQGNMA